MKKVIILLFLAISFVLMTLISYMKFQTALYLESSNEPYDQYRIEASSDSYSAYSQNQSQGF